MVTNRTISVNLVVYILVGGFCKPDSVHCSAGTTFEKVPEGGISIAYGTPKNPSPRGAAFL